VVAPGDASDGPDGLFGGDGRGGSGGGGSGGGGDSGGVLLGDAAWVEVNILSGHGLVPYPVGFGGNFEAHREWAEALLVRGYRRLAKLTNTDVSPGDGDMMDFALVEGVFGVTSVDAYCATDAAAAARVYAEPSQVRLGASAGGAAPADKVR